MTAITTSSNTTLPVGMVADYNNTNAALAVKTYRTEMSANPQIYVKSSGNENSFANAIYGDGPYSLNHPNSISEVLAQNVDVIA